MNIYQYVSYSGNRIEQEKNLNLSIHQLEKQQKNPQKSLGGERKKIETLQYSDLTNKVNKLKSIRDIFSKDTLNNSSMKRNGNIIRLPVKPAKKKQAIHLNCM